MAWPVTAINTTNLDAGADSAASARADLLAAVQAVNEMIAALEGANGVCGLDAGRLISTGRLPVVPITKGGTGATTVAQARANLGIPAGAANSFSWNPIILGEVAVTDGEFGEYVLTNNTSNTWLMNSGRITHCTALNGTSGNTVIAFSLSDWTAHSMVAYNLLTIPFNEKSVASSEAGGWTTSLQIAPGASVHMYIRTAAGHVNMQLHVLFDITSGS